MFFVPSFLLKRYSIRTDNYRYTLWVKWDGLHKTVAGWTGVNVGG